MIGLMRGMRRVGWRRLPFELLEMVGGWQTMIDAHSNPERASLARIVDLASCMNAWTTSYLNTVSIYRLRNLLFDAFLWFNSGRQWVSA